MKINNQKFYKNKKIGALLLVFVFVFIFNISFLKPA
ncbi:MAG: hypothetical protein ACD_18C00020G0001, partial [uncultured bacterium]